MKDHSLDFTMTGRHLELTDGLKQFAQSKLMSLVHLFEYPVKAHMVLDTQKTAQRCTVTLASHPNLQFRAHAESDDMYATMEACFEKLKIQILKKHTRNRHSIHEKSHKRIKDFAEIGLRPNSHALKALCT